MQCDVFHIDIFVASCFGGNQCVSNRAQGGKPIPCTQPFSVQIRPKMTRPELKPNAIFKIADPSRPTNMKERALQRSPRKPLANFETPYNKLWSVMYTPN